MLPQKKKRATPSAHEEPTGHKTHFLFIIISMERMEVKKRILGIDISNYCNDNTGFTYIGVRTGHFIKSKVKGISWEDKFYLAFPDDQIVNACVHNLNC